jgi:hypothetical protein
MAIADYQILDENGDVFVSAGAIRETARLLGVSPKQLAEQDASAKNASAGVTGNRAVAT